jgi:tetratricopeptide (TPR) repeat protein
MKKLIIFFILILFSCNQSNSNNKDIDNSEENNFNQSNAITESSADLKELTDIQLKSYNEAIMRNPNDSWAYYGRASTRMAIEDYKGAVEDFTKSIKLDPMNPSSYLYRADCYVILGKKHKACLDWNQAVILGYSEAKDSIIKNCN